MSLDVALCAVALESARSAVSVVLPVFLVIGGSDGVAPADFPAVMMARWVGVLIGMAAVGPASVALGPRALLRLGFGALAALLLALAFVGRPLGVRGMQLFVAAVGLAVSMSAVARARRGWPARGRAPQPHCASNRTLCTPPAAVVPPATRGQ